MSHSFSTVPEKPPEFPYWQTTGSAVVNFILLIVSTAICGLLFGKCWLSGSCPLWITDRDLVIMCSISVTPNLLCTATAQSDELRYPFINKSL